MARDIQILTSHYIKDLPDSKVPRVGDIYEARRSTEWPVEYEKIVIKGVFNFGPAHRSVDALLLSGKTELFTMKDLFTHFICISRSK